MNSIYTRLLAAALAGASLGAPGMVSAQESTLEAAKPVELTEGEVRKVDREGRKITIKHADIKSLDMPAMTMVFVVRDAAMLEGLNVGDRIRFAATKTDGALVVTVLQRGK